MSFFSYKFGCVFVVQALAVARCDSFPVHEHIESVSRGHDTPSNCSPKHHEVNVNSDSDVSGMMLVQLNARKAYSLQPTPGANEEERLPVGAQIGDLMVPSKRYDSIPPSTTKASNSNNNGKEKLATMYDVEKLKAGQRTLACQKYMHWYDTSSRVALMLLTAPFHGSTAMQGILMSSEHLATLCSFRTWQCEGRTLMEANGYGGNVDKWNLSTMLDVYSEYWNLHRPVLFDKSLRVESAESIRRDLDSAEIPSRMVDVGITKLDRAYVLAWRPLCLKFMSHNARETSHNDFVKVEAQYYRSLMFRHHDLLKNGDTVLVINLADLLWRPWRNQKRLNDFLPCLENINVSYVPKLGRDIYPENKWKADGSVVDFGKSVDPSSFYGVEEQECLEYEPLKMLSVEERDTTFAAIEYLRAFS